MKKNMILIAAIAVSILVSCKKEYICECVTETTTIDSFSDTTYTSESEIEEIKTEKIKKKDAKGKCESMSATFSSGFFGISVVSKTTCKLK